MGNTWNNRGESKTTLYRRYVDMKSRCYNPTSCNYKHYGQRGITVCDEWLGIDGFRNFKKWSLENGFDPSLSIDRIDNNGNYEPNNCRWTTKSIQNMSMRHKNTSGYVGISRHSNGKTWYGRVKVNGKGVYTGMSPNIHEAARMRNDYIIANNLPNVLNVIKEQSNGDT